MPYMIHPWKVVENDFSPSRMRLSESLTSLGNGLMGLRGNFEEDYSGDTHKGSYLGGVWFPDKTRVGWWKNGYPKYFGKVINSVNLIGLHVHVGGERLDLAMCPPERFERVLDMRDGVLTRTFDTIMAVGKVSVLCERFVSKAHTDLLALSYAITAEQDTEIAITAYLDADAQNLDSNYNERFWDMLDGVATPDALGVKAITRENPFGTPRFTVGAAMACACTLPETERTAKPGYCAITYKGTVRGGEAVVLNKFSCVETNRNHAPDALLTIAQEQAVRARSAGYEAERAAHAAKWHEAWNTADVVIEGDDAAQQGIRFNLFHLLSTYTGEDARLNIGPKGFTGEKYGGATYWDTEAYCFPVYMSIAGEAVARQLLLYRYNQLPGAYENARQQGLPGALFPMVTFTGIECHNEWEITFEEIHRNGAIAHAIYDYVNYTGDFGYLRREGLDVLCGIARFFAGRVHLCERTGQYMIHGVTGPNEYENNVNNNWYTNRMAIFCLNYFADAAGICDARRLSQLRISQEELNRMRAIANSMYLPEDQERGVFVQHDTFLDKELRPASVIPEKERPINQHWSWDKILRSCYIKQADVLQGMYFLGDFYDIDTKRRNFNFYEPMTVHESSLSPCVHSILASELGYHDKAVSMYRRTARLDLDNINHDTEDGLHVTSMSGSWLSIVKGFAGMRAERGLCFSPYLPNCFTRYAFKLTYRGRVLFISVDAKTVTLTLEAGKSISVSVYGRDITLENRVSVPIQK